MAVLVASGCRHGELTDPRLETPEARADSVSAAVADITDARCELEDHCNNVGPDRKYASRETCRSKLEGTTASELNTNDCPSGIDNMKLETCIATIRAGECGSVVDTLSRWNACRNGQVCYHRR